MKNVLFKDHLNVPQFGGPSLISLNNSVGISNWAWYGLVIPYLLEIDAGRVIVETPWAQSIYHTLSS